MMSYSFDELLCRAEELAEDALHGIDPVNAAKFGLDLRAAHKLWAGDDFIAVMRSEDRSLNYYGGFEYVNKENRMEVGGYVFYSAQNYRVSRRLDYFRDKAEEEAPLSPPSTDDVPCSAPHPDNKENSNGTRN